MEPLNLTPDEPSALTGRTCAIYKHQDSAELGALFGYDQKDTDGLDWREWFDLNHKRFLMPIEEIAASRVPYAYNPGDLEGVYFLFDQAELQYVGQSVRIAERLRKHVFPHWNRKPVAWVNYYAAIWVPSRLLEVVESYYIHTLRPPRNQQYRTLHSWAAPYIA